MKENVVKTSGRNLVLAIALAAFGVALGAIGIYVGDADDAPGAALLGIVLMTGLVSLGVRMARRRR